MNLRFCMNAAIDCGKPEHPQTVMDDLGISYKNATVQSCADQWWFWGCEGVPEKLPRFLTKLEVTPKQAIGYGLSMKDATPEIARSLNRRLVSVREWKE